MKFFDVAEQSMPQHVDNHKVHHPLAVVSSTMHQARCLLRHPFFPSVVELGDPLGIVLCIC